MNVVAVPIIESNTELQGTRHSSMTARGVGGTTNRDSLSARQTNGAAMLVEVDAAAVAVLLLVRLIAKVREVVRRLLVRKEVEPQKLAIFFALVSHMCTNHRMCTFQPQTWGHKAKEKTRHMKYRKCVVINTYCQCSLVTLADQANCDLSDGESLLHCRRESIS